MSLDDLKESLKAGAEKVSEGRIRLDARKALEKLKDHRLADPHHYVLELLRAVAASKATHAEIRVDADDFELRFDGAGFAPAVIRDLLSHALGGGGNAESQAARFLALGVAGALGLDPAWVRVQGAGLTLEVRPPVAVEVEARRDGSKGTFVHVRERVSWRVLRDAVVGPVELGIIRKAVRRFPATLTLNGKPFAPASLFDEELLAQAEKRVGEAKVVVAVPAARLKASTLTLDIFGVGVVTRTLALPLLQVRAWARDDGLRRNASGSDVVDGDAPLAKIQKAVGQLAEELLGKLIARLTKEDDPAVRELITELAVDAAHAKKLSKLPSSLRAVLDRAPILPGPSGEWVTVAELRAEERAGRQLRFALQAFPPGSYTRPAVLLADPSLGLEALLPMTPRIDVAKEVAARRAAAERRQAWAASPVELAVLPGDDYLVCAKFETESLSGEVGFRADRGFTSVRFLSMGKRVQQTEPFELEPLELHAVIDLKRPLPEKAWAELPVRLGSGKLFDALSDAAVRAITTALAAGPTPTPRLAEHARALLQLLVKRQKAPRVKDLPEALRQRPIFETAGGGWTSLEDLVGGSVCRFVSRKWPYPSLHGLPVVVLKEPEQELLERLGARLKDYAQNLGREVEVRAQLAGRGEKPRVRLGSAAKVLIDQEGVRGEAAVPSEAVAGLSLRLLMKGFVLEECTLPARYDLAEVVVECPELKADETWHHAVRNGVFDGVVAVVRASERQLAGALLAEHPNARLDELKPGARRFLAAFLRKELDGFLRKTAPGNAPELDELQKAVSEAPLFLGPSGPLSLRQVAEACRPAKKLWVLPPPLPRDVPESVPFVVASPAVAQLLSDVLELAASDAREELARAHERATFNSLPERAAALPDSVHLRATVELERVKGLIGFEPDRPWNAEVEVLYERRLLRQLAFPNLVPLRAVLELESGSIDPASPSLAATLDKLVGSALEQGEAKLIEAALQDPEGQGARELLLQALGARLDVLVPARSAQRLLGLPLLPCTDGVARSAETFDQLERVAFVTEEIAGRPRSGEPVIVATPGPVNKALARWSKKWADITAPLIAEFEGRRRLEALPVIEKVTVSGPALRRVSFDTAAHLGEIALVPRDGGRLELLHRRRALCTVAEPRIPPSVAVAVNCDALTPNPGHTAALHDDAYQALLKACDRQLEVLANTTAKAMPELPPEEKAALTPALAHLALFLFAKKRAGKALMQLPLYERTDGQLLSLHQLGEEQRRFRRVRISAGTGSPLGEGAWVWRPRMGEAELLAKSPLKLKDGTLDLVHAAQVRQRPKVSSLAAPLESRWRAPVAGAGLEGEVALPPFAPTGKLVVQVLRERSMLETLALEHPIGGVARVNSDALKPNREWTKAVRNEAFRELRQAVEDALERLTAQRLVSGQGEEGWRPFLAAAVRWKLGGAGPVAAELPGLTLFEDLAGLPLTLGAVLADISKYGRVAVASPGQPPDLSFEGVVLRGDEESRALLADLELEHEDVTQDLRRKADLEVSRNARRLVTLRYQGAALARHEVSFGLLKGELALAAEDGPDQELTLARAGIKVAPYDDGGLGVAGVLDHPELPVNEDWTEARPTPELRRAIAEQIDALFGRLATLDEGLSPAERRRAARFVLRFLSTRGTSAPAHLDALPAPLWKLGSCKLFCTCDGRWVDLRALAGRVHRGGKVALVYGSIGADEVRGDLVLDARSLGADGEDALEKVLGRGSVVTRSLAQWRADREEEDPEDGTPLGEGLTKLRRESRLLKDGALGRLSAEELKHIKLQRRKGRVPLRYDAGRKTAFLDPGHPAIKRALEEHVARPDRFFVLLVAIYGAVNRGLAHITDEDELRLVGGLMGHLAANWQILGVPSDPALD